jgi:hypothetical protein
MTLAGNMDYNTENRMLKEVFGAEKKEISEQFRTLHNKE